MTQTGNLRFLAGEVRAHAAHIDGEKLVRVAADRRRSVSHFLVVRKIEIRVVFRRYGLFFHRLERRQKTHAARLVVQKTGFYKSALRHRRFGIERYHAARADPQRIDLLGGRHFLVQTDVHGIFVAFQRPRVLIDVTGAGIARKVPV